VSRPGAIQRSDDKRLDLHDFLRLGVSRAF
jgi:hypothetical protein